MADRRALEGILRAALVAPEVFALRPDYRVLLVAVDGIVPGPSDAAGERLLQVAEESARTLLAEGPIEGQPHIAAWREAYRGFGAKPQRTRNSAEALLRRAAAGGLPRVNRLTDLYNALSVLHRIPLGGEDLSRYVGSPRLVRATGSERFVTSADGQELIERPEPGEVVWCDDEGVTCRRWNWRQCRRTLLDDHTTRALFILDALSPLTDAALEAAGEQLSELLHGLGPEVTTATRLIGARG